MVSITNILMLIIDFLICFIIPIGLFIIFQIKYKKLFKSLILGAAAFFISQELIRIPILQYVLPQFSWFIVLQIAYPYLYYIFLGLTAGIFEEVGRFLVIKYLMKDNQRYIDSVTFGIGHGAIEAILLTGVGVLSCLIGVITNTLQLNLINVAPLDILIAGVERLFAMCIHVGLTMIVFNGFRKNRQVLYLIIAILIHAMVDASIGILPGILGISGCGFEAVVGVVALIMIIYTIYSRNHGDWIDNNINKKDSLNLKK